MTRFIYGQYNEMPARNPRIDMWGGLYGDYFESIYIEYLDEQDKLWCARVDRKELVFDPIQQFAFTDISDDVKAEWVRDK